MSMMERRAPSYNQINNVEIELCEILSSGVYRPDKMIVDVFRVVRSATSILFDGPHIGVFVPLLQSTVVHS